MKLIRELNEATSQIVESSEGGIKHYVISGVFMQSEVKNRNGRIYPRSVMESALDKYLVEKVSKRQAWGELGHPTGPKINETLVSHLIEELKWDGNNVIGRAKVLNYGNGLVIRGMIEAGGSVGVSSRALGSLKERNGIMEVQDLYISTAADVVVDPSAPDAFVTAVYEGMDWVYDAATDSFKQKQVDQVVEKVKTLSSRELQEKKLAAFEAYLAVLAGR